MESGKVFDDVTFYCCDYDSWSRGRHVLPFKRATFSFSRPFDEAKGSTCVDSPSSSHHSVQSESKHPIPIMTVLPRNELVSLSGQSATSPTSQSGGGAEPMANLPSPAGIGERSEKSVGPSFCSTSCDHACAPSQPEQLQHGNRPTNEYVLVSGTACNDSSVGTWYCLCE
jgi:hypothetical protein